MHFRIWAYYRVRMKNNTASKFLLRVLKYTPIWLSNQLQVGVFTYQNEEFENVDRGLVPSVWLSSPGIYYRL